MAIKQANIEGKTNSRKTRTSRDAMKIDKVEELSVYDNRLLTFSVMRTRISGVSKVS